jgi:hypothetical protein
MTAWSHLPNARHIDLILDHLKAHPQKWTAARGAAWDAARVAARDAAWDAARYAARVVARDAARDAAWVVAWDAARDAAWGAALDAARGAALDAARNAAWYAIAALVAWDDCAYILGLPADAVKVLVACGNQPAILLYPAVLAMSEEEKV